MSRIVESFLWITATVVACAIMVRMQVKPYWIYLIFVVIALTVPWVVGRVQVHRHEAKYGAELKGPFRAEVLLDGAPVAILTERRYTEMFWRSYRIEPLSEETAKLVYDTELWNECRFTFRDPATGMECRTGLVGGVPPFIHDGRISLRALYFLPPEAAAARVNA